MIRTNIRIGKYSNIFEYPNIRHTMIRYSVTLVTFGVEYIYKKTQLLLIWARGSRQCLFRKKIRIIFCVWSVAGIVI